MAHRTGRLEPGEAAVGVAAASAHRGEAFAAARFCIERVKAELPVWKKEWSPDGQGSWVDHP
jgi:molybdopterin synthase catalytic subunit